jgi:hypothetical protein
MLEADHVAGAEAAPPSSQSSTVPMIAVCLRSIVLAAALFVLGLLLGLGLHLIAPGRGESHAGRNVSVVVTRPATDPIALAAVSAPDGLEAPASSEAHGSVR